MLIIVPSLKSKWIVWTFNSIFCKKIQYWSFNLYWNEKLFQHFVKRFSTDHWTFNQKKHVLCKNSMFCERVQSWSLNLYWNEKWIQHFVKRFNTDHWTFNQIKNVLCKNSMFCEKVQYWSLNVYWKEIMDCVNIQCFVKRFSTYWSLNL